MMKNRKIISMYVVMMIVSTGFIAFLNVVPEEASAQGGPIEIGTAVTIGLAVLNEVKEAIKSMGKATTYVKAKTDGPDSDDRAVDFDWDSDNGLDWSLDAETDSVNGWNDVDDKEEKPYTSGDYHEAYIEIHFESSGGVWEPDPGDCANCPDDEKNTECYGWVFAEPDDDPAAENEKTYAAAAGAFSADGKTVDFTYSAQATTTGGGTVDYSDVSKVAGTRAPAPEIEFECASGFLASTGRFDFEPKTGDKVMIQPLMGPTIDLFHIYLQENNSMEMFPVIRGYDQIVQDLKQDAYDERVNGSSWVLTETGQANLTIVGAAIQLKQLEVTRGQRSNAELLIEYFASDSAISIVAPKNAQEGYQPQIEFREQVKSGQNISDVIGRQYILPVNGKQSAEVEEDPLVGFVFSVKGGIDEAVELALNTEGHYVRDIANKSMNTRSDTVEFTIPSTNFHFEDSSSFSDIAVASPAGDETPTLVNTMDSGLTIGDFVSTGGASGLVADLTVTSTSDEPLVIGLAPSGLEGMVLVNPNNGEQDLVIADLPGVYSTSTRAQTYEIVSEITLGPGESIVLPVMGYCINFDMKNPTKGANFSLNSTSKKTDIAQVKTILDVLDETTFPGRTPSKINQLKQIAIWAGQPENKKETADDFAKRGYTIEIDDIPILKDILNETGVDITQIEALSDTEKEPPDDDTTDDEDEDENEGFLYSMGSIGGFPVLVLLLIIVIIVIVALAVAVNRSKKKRDTSASKDRTNQRDDLEDDEDEAGEDDETMTIDCRKCGEEIVVPATSDKYPMLAKCDSCGAQGRLKDPPLKTMNCKKCDNKIKVPYAKDEKVVVECSECGAKGRAPNPYLK